jgi:hypothetical protein
MALEYRKDTHANVKRKIITGFVADIPLPYSIFPVNRTMVAVNRCFDAQSGEDFRRSSDNSNDNDYLEKVPTDHFSNAGEPMSYGVNDDFTGYMVYSTGRNRADDGGQEDSRQYFGDILRKRNY